ncbi:MAG TPA: hypothetical protein DCF33_03705, partial [Saprospirales bacterium]|nr:hypothetical protein [Saprospirales bacterium]
MKYIWDNKWFFAPAICFFFIGGLMAVMIPYGEEIIFFNQLRVEPLNGIFRFITMGGEVWAYLVFGLPLLFFKPRYALIVAITGFLSIPIMYLLKDAIGVDRPV